MKRIGLLVGRERSFPDALIAEINRGNSGAKAEYVKVGPTPTSMETGYSVILDRISHEVVFYQPWLKAAVLSGTVVVNNPFWRMADDKFFGTALAERLGVHVPKTLVLPSHSYPESIIDESLSNLKYPINWEEVVGYTGLPAILKPHWGGGWKDVHRVNSIEELLTIYDQTGRLCMILQEFIDWQQYVRCICIGKSKILVTHWDPRKPHHERYSGPQQKVTPTLSSQIEHEAILLNQALGYDMNTVEFAIRDGIPYAIDFMNSAPDFDITSLTQKYFSWVVRAMADLLVEYATSERKPSIYRWDALMDLR